MAWLTCPFFFLLGFAVLVIVVIVKNLSKQGYADPDGPPRRRAGPPRPPVRVHQAADGFWLHAPQASPGSVIHYRYWSGGTMRTGSVAVSHAPKGTFVYTGAVPAQIEVVDVVPPGQSRPAEGGYSGAGGSLAPGDAPARESDGYSSAGGSFAPDAPARESDGYSGAGGSFAPDAPARESDGYSGAGGSFAPDAPARDSDGYSGAGGSFAPDAPAQDSPSAPEPFTGPPPAY